MNRDVLIIGGGVIGLSIGRELHKQGVGRITIVERGEIGKEASYAAAGMLGPQAEANAGGPFFDLCVQSRDLYPAFAAELLEETGVDIELDRNGTLYLAFTDDDASEMLKRYEWQTRTGLEVEHLSADEARRAEPFVSTTVRTGLFFPNDWQVENRKLLIALQKYAELNGIEIRESIEINSLISEAGKITGAASETESFFAGKTILATGAWTSFIKLDDLGMPINVKPIRGQMISFQSAERQFQRVIYSPRGYIVPRVDGRILAGSTSEDVGFDKSVTGAAVQHLREMALEIAPCLVNLEIVDKWAGLRPMASDCLPVLGEILGYRDLFVATAHYRNGILLAPLTGKLMASRIAENKESEHLRAFSPERFRSVGVGSVR